MMIGDFQRVLFRTRLKHVMDDFQVSAPVGLDQSTSDSPEVLYTSSDLHIVIVDGMEQCNRMIWALSGV